MMKNQTDGTDGVVGTRTTVTLLIPVLNEIDGLKLTLPRINRTIFDDILLVDGGSTDGSVEYARAHGIRVVTQRRPGLAFAVLDAIVDEITTDYVVEFSPDGNCLVEDLPRLVQRLREGYYLVVVSRYLPPAKSYDDTMVTAFGNRVLSLMIQWLGEFPITDGLTIFRGFRREIVHSPGFSKYVLGPVFEPLVSGFCNLHGMKMCEIAGDEPPRVAGGSHMRVFYNGSCILLMIIRLYVFKIFKVVV